MSNHHSILQNYIKNRIGRADIVYESERVVKVSSGSNEEDERFRSTGACKRWIECSDKTLSTLRETIIEKVQCREESLVILKTPRGPKVETQAGLDRCKKKICIFFEERTS